MPTTEHFCRAEDSSAAHNIPRAVIIPRAVFPLVQSSAAFFFPRRHSEQLCSVLSTFARMKAAREQMVQLGKIIPGHLSLRYKTILLG